MEAGVPEPEANPPRLDTAAVRDQLERVEADLAEVATAMVRLDEGTYGTCETCGSTLGDDVLAAAPAARACPDHR